MSASDEVFNLSAQEAIELRAKALAAKVDNLPDGYYRSPRIIGTFFAVTLNLAGSYFGFQASAAAISYINADVGPSDNVNLFSTVWTVAQAISLLMMGRLTDIFGRRYYVVGTNVCGVIGGIIACTAQSIETLIGAQVLLGLCAGQAAGYCLLIGEIMSNKHKFVGVIIVALPNVLTGFGPYLGQRLGAQGHWRYIFYILLALLVPALIISFIFYRPPSFVQIHGKKISRREEVKRMDWVGLFLLTAGVTLLLLGVSWGGQPNSPWNSPRIIGLLISGGVSLAAFVLWEIFSKAELPIVPLHLYKDVRGFVCLTIISYMAGTLSLALFILYPQQIQRLYASSSSGWEDVAWMSSVPSFATWFGICLLGSIVHIVKHIRFQFISQMIWLTAFLGAMSTLTSTQKGRAMAFAFLTGLFVGFLQDATMLTTQYVTADVDLGVAFAIVCGGRSIFSALFNAAFIALYQNKFPGQLQSKLVPAVEKAGLSASSIPQLLEAVTADNATAIAAVPGMTPALQKITANALASAWAGSYAYVYYFAVALGGIGIIASLCLRDFDHYMNDHVPHQIYTSEETKKDVIDSSSESESHRNITEKVVQGE